MKTYHISVVVTVDGKNPQEAVSKVRTMLRTDVVEVKDHDIIAVDEISDDSSTD